MATLYCVSVSIGRNRVTFVTCLSLEPAVQSVWGRRREEHDRGLSRTRRGRGPKTSGVVIGRDGLIEKCPPLAQHVEKRLRPAIASATAPPRRSRGLPKIGRAHV